MINISNRGKIILLITILLVIFGSFAGYNYLNSTQLLSIDLSTQVTNPTITISENTETSDSGSEVNYSNIGSEIKLKKGNYRVTFQAENFTEQNIDVSLDDQPETLTIAPTYTDEQLSKLLKSEGTNITKVINQQIPETTSTYEITDGKLYQLGEWYAARLSIKQTPEQERENYIDIYKIVLKKEGEQWKLVTKPPELIISSPKYPAIPEEILIDVNKNPGDDLAS